MRGCDPVSAAAKLKMALDSLNRARAEVAMKWDDPMSRAFDEEFLDSVESRVKRALDAIGHLTETLTKAERECAG